jgi:hypothetical protein
MTDNDTSAVEQNNDNNTAVEQTDVNPSSAVEGNDKPNSVPYARFNELNKNFKKLQSELTTIKDSQEQSRLKRLEEEGKINELNAELHTKNKDLTAKVEYYQNLEQQEREGLLNQLPKEDQEIYGELTTPKLRAHVNTFKSSATTLKTDSGRPKRGNPLKVKNDAEIWDMDGKTRKSNWANILEKFNNK